MHWIGSNKGRKTYRCLQQCLSFQVCFFEKEMHYLMCLCRGFFSFDGPMCVCVCVSTIKNPNETRSNQEDCAQGEELAFSVEFHQDHYAHADVVTFGSAITACHPPAFQHQQPYI